MTRVWLKHLELYLLQSFQMCKNNWLRTKTGAAHFHDTNRLTDKCAAIKELDVCIHIVIDAAYLSWDHVFRLTLLIIECNLLQWLLQTFREMSCNQRWSVNYWLWEQTWIEIKFVGSGVKYITILIKIFGFKLCQHIWYPKRDNFDWEGGNIWL